MSQVIDLTQAENRITETIVDCAYKVHSKLGPGLLESIYEECLCHELDRRNLKIERQKTLPIKYDNLLINSGLRLDIVVEDKIILELKSVEKFLPVHQAQIISYLRLSDMPIGFLINFNVPYLKQGLKRFVNDFKNSANSAAPR
jgi:GxxExxY protein